MKFIQVKSRNQWEMYCLDAHVDADNEVRLIDLFVGVVTTIWVTLITHDLNFFCRYYKTP
jgi:hypothetical protein